MQRSVLFYSEGSKIAANLYLPNDSAEQKPAVVLAHGFSGIKELLLPAYGERLSAAGFVVLAFDYRGFGGSEGERGRLVPLEQMTDIRNAITFMQTLPEVKADAIGLWGSSFGGANALRVAAIDDRVTALVAQLTFGSGRRMVTGKMSPEERAQLAGTLKKAREREVTKNRPLRLSPEQLISDEDSKAFFGKALREYPALSGIKIPFTLLQHIIEHNPDEEVQKITCPVLLLSADNDIVTPPGESQILYDRIQSEKRLVTLENCRHYEAYAGEPFEKGITEIITWFSTYLKKP